MKLNKVFLLKEGAGETIKVFDLLRNYTGTSSMQEPDGSIRVIIDGSSGGVSFKVVLSPDGGIQDIIPE